MPSGALALESEQPLTPAMVSAIWEIAAALDEQRVPAQVSNSVWLEVPTLRLRGEGGRSDNVWLRQCLDRLTGIKISGEHKGDPWGAVVLAEWHIVHGGSLARLLIPPAGIHALRSPSNFTKIEAAAVHQLSGHGRRLYALLADKKRLGRPYWTFELGELRKLMGVTKQKSYDRFNTFRQRVLDPAVDAINDYGTVTIRITPERQGRAVYAVRFDWRWKDLHDAAETAIESDRHSSARRKQQQAKDAPPMIEDPKEAARLWWAQLSDKEREAWAERIGRTAEIGGMIRPRPERIIREMAFEANRQTLPPLPRKTEALQEGQ